MEERKNKDIIINILHTTQMTNCLNNNSEIYWEHIHLLLVEMLHSNCKFDNKCIVLVQLPQQYLITSDNTINFIGNHFHTQNTHTYYLSNVYYFRWFIFSEWYRSIFTVDTSTLLILWDVYPSTNNCTFILNINDSYNSMIAYIYHVMIMLMSIQ